MQLNQNISEHYRNNFQLQLTSISLISHLQNYNVNKSDIESAYFESDLTNIEALASLEIASEMRAVFENLLSQIVSWPEQLEWLEFVEYYKQYFSAWIKAYAAGLDIAIGLLLSQAIHLKFASGIQSEKYSLHFMALTAETASHYNSYLIDYFSNYDRYSGLPNANAMQKSISEILVQGQSIGLIYIAVNLASSSKPAQSPEENLALPEVALLLQNNLGEGCQLYKLENDEFAILIPDVEQAVQLELLAVKLLRAFEATLHVNGRPYALRPWFGCIYHHETHSTADTVCMKARLTLDHAMKSGKNISTYSTNLIEEAFQHSELEHTILDAFEDGRFELYIQPIVDISKDICDYAEVLLRCKNGDYFVPPPSLVDVLYKHGLGGKFVRWLLSTACRLGSEIQSALHYPVCLSVNLTADDLIGHELPFLLSQSLDLWNLKANHITLEITENGLLLDETSANQTIQQLIDLGCSIALDDFGTGYSSMTRLRSMPIDIVKIDQSFVRNINKSNEDLEIVRAVIMLARSLGKTVVAEGVEDIETLTILDDLGCKKIQGYYYSKAMPIDEFIGWAKAFEK